VVERDMAQLRRDRGLPAARLVEQAGQSYSWTFRLKITDPVKVAIMSDGWVQ
jgi:hypothetical protein